MMTASRPAIDTVSSAQGRPNILLIILDATRRDACSCYNPALTTTPALDRLAASGLRFDDAVTCAPWTLPAMSTLLTGLYPRETGIYETRVLPPSIPTLPALLGEQGYGTFAITNNSWMSTEFGLTRDFQRLHKLWQAVQTDDDITPVNLTQGQSDVNVYRAALQRVLRGNVLKNAWNLLYYKLRRYPDYGAQRSLAPVQRWIDGQQGRPWFAMVHYLEAHMPYTPPRVWARRFVDDWPAAQRFLKQDQRAVFWRHLAGVETLGEADLAVWRQLYLAEVAYQDHHMGLLLDWLDQRGYDDNTYVVAVADHGESLGEHGLLDHQYGVYETLARVPMVIRGPGIPAGQVNPHQVQTLDLFTTILGWAECPMPEHAGQDLTAAGAGSTDAFIEYGIPRRPHGPTLARFGVDPASVQSYLRGYTALRTATHKLVLASDGRVTLYDLRNDPDETADLSAARPELVESLRRRLDQWQSDHPPAAAGEDAPAVSAELQAHLRSLGYLE